jgi:hypothetical protein
MTVAAKEVKRLVVVTLAPSISPRRRTACLIVEIASGATLSSRTPRPTSKATACSLAASSPQTATGACPATLLQTTSIRRDSLLTTSLWTGARGFSLRLRGGRHRHGRWPADPHFATETEWIHGEFLRSAPSHRAVLLMTPRWDVISECDLCGGDGGTPAQPCPVCHGMGTRIEKARHLPGRVGGHQPRLWIPVRHRMTSRNAHWVAPRRNRGEHWVQSSASEKCNWSGKRRTAESRSFRDKMLD